MSASTAPIPDCASARPRTTAGDWSYIWNLLYFGDLQANLIIILKASLKWIPVVGPAMQCFRFIFISRNWAADRVSLGNQLNDLAERASRSLDSFVLLICAWLSAIQSQCRHSNRRT